MVFREWCRRLAGALVHSMNHGAFSFILWAVFPEFQVILCHKMNETHSTIILWPGNGRTVVSHLFTKGF